MGPAGRECQPKEKQRGKGAMREQGEDFRGRLAGQPGRKSESKLYRRIAYYSEKEKAQRQEAVGIIKVKKRWQETRQTQTGHSN